MFPIISPVHNHFWPPTWAGPGKTRISIFNRYFENVQKTCFHQYLKLTKWNILSFRFKKITKYHLIQFET
jgi:hypothetical protein